MDIVEKKFFKRQAKYVGLFCNARDEKNIKEWAAHHLLIGFDIIIIFDHKSKKPLKEVFSNFDKRVQIIRIELEDGNVKQALMNNATKISNDLQLDWFIYLDADEFLILKNFFKDVKHFLNSFSYADSIGINWLMFGSNYLVEEPDGLILENYTKSSSIIDQHVKSFVRPKKIKFTDNPHYYHVKNPSKMLGINYKVIHYPYCLNNLNIKIINIPAYIAHYVYQSEETYKKRKIDLIGDNGIMRENLGNDIHNNYNDITNLEPQKYVKKIKQFLQYYN